ncbi:DUF192 domain-containing protein [Sphingomonas sp. LB-2]|uniref:DUF192 domain-containing protein n=1 Tax=Sphingomonas caeni TaxID=2984949 RepID=UPI002231043A|nr:DUF192 domain-containing protein [Sphingomonas caeni]MCW3847524.1 DUF192 domain-containing protein [Sphingomonas caeni]
MKVKLAIAAGLLLALGGCGSGGENVANEAETALVTVTIATAEGPRTLKLEVADSEAEQTRGLMYRSNIPPDGGLLVAPYPPNGGAPEEVNFWTKNVPVPIDFIFIRPDGTIARIAENALPLSEARIPSGEPVAAIIEINGGRSAELGISPGDAVSWRGQKKQ